MLTQVRLYPVSTLQHTHVIRIPVSYKDELYLSRIDVQPAHLPAKTVIAVAAPIKIAIMISLY